jgi:hypothetical protein
MQQTLSEMSHTQEFIWFCSTTLIEKNPSLHRQKVLQLGRERSPPHQCPLALNCLGNPTLAESSRTTLRDELTM